MNQHCDVDSCNYSKQDVQIKCMCKMLVRPSRQKSTDSEGFHQKSDNSPEKYLAKALCVGLDEPEQEDVNTDEEEYKANLTQFALSIVVAHDSLLSLTL